MQQIQAYLYNNYAINDKKHDILRSARVYTTEHFSLPVMNGGQVSKWLLLNIIPVKYLFSFDLRSG